MSKLPSSSSVITTVWIAVPVSRDNAIDLTMCRAIFQIVSIHVRLGVHESTFHIGVLDPYVELLALHEVEDALQLGLTRSIRPVTVLR